MTRAFTARPECSWAKLGKLFAENEEIEDNFGMERTMAAVLYYNGTIITMCGERPETVEAVLVESGMITAAGSLADLECRRTNNGQGILKRNLHGAVMLPAFIDAHSHITAVAQTLGYTDLAGKRNFEEIINALKAFKEHACLKPGQWLVGVGYDHNFLDEKKHPDKLVLDRAFKENPVMLSHASGHMGVVNSKALELLGITPDSAAPVGGLIGRIHGTREPDGYLEETAFTGAGAIIPKPSMEQLSKQLAMAEQIYLSNGITTVQDGLTRSQDFDMLRYRAEHEGFLTDVVCYADMKSDRDLLEHNPDYAGSYRNHLRIGGYKILLDGSPQGRTAWMTKPYKGAADGYHGYPIYGEEEVEQYFETALREKRQLLVHCNGDAAGDQMLYACVSASKKTGCDPSSIRPVMIHAQLVREDQLERMAGLSMTASFFVAHVYYWGDIHLKNFGRERAQKLSPVKTALQKGLNVTFHQDSPVIKPNMPETIWCAVNRVSKAGLVLGSDESISPYEALKAVTINAAWQYGEESEKGSIEIGKRADFVILDQNPMEVKSEQLLNIRVLETIKDGRTLYRDEKPHK